MVCEQTHIVWYISAHFFSSDQKLQMNKKEKFKGVVSRKKKKTRDRAAQNTNYLTYIKLCGKCQEVYISPQLYWFPKLTHKTFLSELPLCFQSNHILSLSQELGVHTKLQVYRCLNESLDVLESVPIRLKLLLWNIIYWSQAFNLKWFENERTMYYLQESQGQWWILLQASETHDNAWILVCWAQELTL